MGVIEDLAELIIPFSFQATNDVAAGIMNGASHNIGGAPVTVWLEIKKTLPIVRGVFYGHLPRMLKILGPDHEIPHER